MGEHRLHTAVRQHPLVWCHGRQELPLEASIAKITIQHRGIVCMVVRLLQLQVEV